jgi:hypothetical protein
MKALLSMFIKLLFLLYFILLETKVETIFIVDSLIKGSAKIFGMTFEPKTVNMLSIELFLNDPQIKFRLSFIILFAIKSVEYNNFFKFDKVKES